MNVELLRGLLMSEITYDSLKNNGVFTNIPILTLDERWYHLVNDKIKTDEIAYWEKRVNELLKNKAGLILISRILKS